MINNDKIIITKLNIDWLTNMQINTIDMNVIISMWGREKIRQIYFILAVVYASNILRNTLVNEFNSWSHIQIYSESQKL